ncbi:MAG: DUF692 domain-containing protein [Polyangiaceae bacterium]|nr:DUF692 domain-containing protein [Polyangiaceae bacterium]
MAGRKALSGARGIGHRPELAADLLSAPSSVDFVEVVAETCFAEGSARREAVALARMWPVVPHGVKLSLGSAEGIELEKAQRLGALARDLNAPVVTEHVALTKAAGREIGHLTPVPRCAEVVRAVARNTSRARSALPDVPFLLENIATPFAHPGDVMSEPDFYSEIVGATGCDLLLDVANLYANAINAHADPIAMARAFPLDHVGMVHIAGGVFEDEFYFDTHAHAVPDAVFDILAVVFEVRPDVPIVLERDAHFGDGLAPLVAEIDRAHALRGSRAGAGEMAPRAPIEPRAGDRYGGNPARLASDQSELARLLTESDPGPSDLAGAVGSQGLGRARNILQRKRVDDALPLLPRLGRRATEVRALAERVVASSPRGPSMQAVLDAVAIAEAATNERRLSADAIRDRLTMHARFAIPRPADVARGAAPSVRRGPYVARTTTESGSVVWAVKGFGSLAKVFLREGAKRAEPAEAKR